MPRLKLDDVKQLAEPIIIEAGIISDKEYRVEKVTTDLMDKVDALTPKKDEKNPEGKGKVDTVIKQLALLLNVPVEEVSGVDLRVASKVLTFISEAITAGVTKENPTAAGAK